MMRIGIIGQGTLGNAIARGLANHARVRVIDGTTRASASENPSLVASSDVVLLCVKPKDMPVALEEISQSITREHILISTAATIHTHAIRDQVPF